ncbi:MAG: hypothetical protein OXE46_03865 [Chloroflexi bacterium]|nr:hypothetical protein [Chloroflexota bacterium]
MASWNDNSDLQKRKSRVPTYKYDSANGNGKSIRFWAVALIALILGITPIMLEFSKLGASKSDAKPLLKLEPRCDVFTSKDRGVFDISLYISGDKQERAVIDIIMPGNSVTEKVYKRYRKEFSDTNEPYILQTYSDYDWKPGNYTVKWSISGKSGKKTLNLDDSDHRIDVYCN